MTVEIVITALEVEERARRAGIPVTPAGYMRGADVAEFFKVSIRTVERWQQEGDFPAGIQLGGRRSLWYHCGMIADFMCRAESRQSATFTDRDRP